MSTTAKTILKSLTFWVLLSIAAGIVIGIADPERAVQMEFLGKGFISVVKLFINPIIFLTITLGIAAMGDLKKVGKTGGKALIYFEVVTSFALLIGVAVAFVIQPGAGVDTTRASGAEIGKYVTGAQQFSWLHFFQDNLTLQVLVVSLVTGSLISLFDKQQRFIKPLTFVSKYVFKALHIVMYAAPIGAFGGMAYTVGKFGPSALVSLAKLMAAVYTTMGIFVFVVLGAILWMYRIRIIDFLKYIKEELLIVLGTSSSEAALPSLMEKLERMGCAKPIVGLTVPAGYSFNLDGTTIYLSMACIFLAQAYNVHLSMDKILTLIGILLVTSKGAAGVTGSGFIVLATTLQAVKSIPIEGLALLIGVDRFMSEARAITNMIGNGVATVWLSNNEKAFDRGKMLEAFQKTPTSLESPQAVSGDGKLPL
ncbi:aerobic C4-dicarboxylate transport protein [Chryseolinea serpens]|uniref:Aerobic C4-dicarboxylate transport protein n=1 Tax=Chryseolinea serpens TaxID=947013 RepID=A0A1M5LE08_9BACT|nr:cation:dicarboxylase symporter family transporter [Chryseolinea serpens]SHG63195.1 aerobic C4-dicarboxylate transport protein [Chryseolinea serpens]